MASGEFARHKRAGIEYEVGTLKHFATAHRHQVGVARTGTHNLDVSLLVTQMLAVDGYSGSPILAFYLGNNQLAIIRAQNRRRLTHAGSAHMFCYGVTWSWHIHRL